MKKIILLLALLVNLAFVRAQETHHYLTTSTRYRDTAGNFIAYAEGNPEGGSFKISRHLISFDMAKAYRKVYAIIHCGKWEPYDEGYTLKEIIVSELAGPNQLRLCRILILRDQMKRITDISVEYPNKEVDYLVRAYTPQYGYKVVNMD